MSKKLKMKMFGLFLVLLGLVIIVYSIISSTSMGFFSIYLGMLMLVTGLSILGFNAGTYGIG